MGTDLRRRLIAAKLAGQGPKLSGTIDRDDHAYRFRDNEQAADAALAALGLDDLDAAARRLVVALADYRTTEEVGDLEARKALEAALTATGEGRS